MYASTNLLYGANRKLPFDFDDALDHLLSPYASSKKAYELSALTCSQLHGPPTTGLSFLTVHGLCGRHDFIYIDDIVEGVVRALEQPAEPDPALSAEQPNPGNSNARQRTYTHEKAPSAADALHRVA